MGSGAGGDDSSAVGVGEGELGLAAAPEPDDPMAIANAANRSTPKVAALPRHALTAAISTHFDSRCWNSCLRVQPASTVSQAGGDQRGFGTHSHRHRAARAVKLGMPNLQLYDSPVQLSGLAIGSQGEVVDIGLDQRLVIRFMELGLAPGATVRLLGRCAGSVRVAVGATRVAIANEYADRICLNDSSREPQRSAPPTDTDRTNS